METDKKFPIMGEQEENTIEQFKALWPDAERGALMADGHYGYIAPVGSVLAYKNAILPAGVGYDIGCGNLAVKLDLPEDSYSMTANLDMTLNWIQNHIPFGMGRARSQSDLADHPMFDDPELWKVYDKHEREALFKLARKQLGTVGSGNHYVDLFVDDNGFYWIGVHFGSRGLGHKTATGFMNLEVNGMWGEKAPEQYILMDMDSELGERYWKAMELCGTYAYAGREDVVKRIMKYLGCGQTFAVHNHHNYAWIEEHDGEDLVVIRKGATPLHDGQQGFVGASMAETAHILEGKPGEASDNILNSTVHGAGRVMGRMRAKGKIHRKTGRVIREGEVKREEMDTWLAKSNVKLRGGDVDEAPQCYKRLTDVIDYHIDTITIKERLHPIGVVMAGNDVRDPYKD